MYANEIYLTILPLSLLRFEILRDTVRFIKEIEVHVLILHYLSFIEQFFMTERLRCLLDLTHSCDLVSEIVRAMNYVISKGWVMYWGTSRWTPVEIMEAYTNCRQFNCVTPIVEQAEYHLFYREKPELYMPELYNKIGN